MISTTLRFRKVHRIQSKKRIKEILKFGKHEKTELFECVYLSNNLQNSRLAVITPKKLGNAVVRNKLRRRIKEIFRINIPLYASGSDMIFFPNADMIHCSFFMLLLEYQKFLKKV